MGGIDLGVKLEELEDGSRLTLHIITQNNHMDLGATIKKHLDANIVLIDLEYSGPKRLVFDKVLVNVEYFRENDLPVVWHNATVINYKDEYVLRVHSEGVRNNRRGAYRVAVAQMASCHIEGQGTKQVMIKDISISGFAITDRKKELGFSIGDKVTISFEDWGHKIRLAGRMVRVEPREDMIIYGFQICSQCNDLQSYINSRQRRNKK